MTFAITQPQPGDRCFIIPQIPAGILSQPLADAIERYSSFYDADIGPGGADAANAWGDAASDIAEHVAMTGTELAVKLLFIAHYNQPRKLDGALAIDLASFDVDTGRAIVRAAADALTMDAARLWLEARAEYERVRSISDAIPPAPDGEDAALDAYCVAMDTLIATPAPNVQAAAYKLALIQARAEGGTPNSYWQVLSADLARLGGQA
jgi:hypothetical protein